MSNLGVRQAQSLNHSADRGHSPHRGCPREVQTTEHPSGQGQPNHHPTGLFFRYKNYDPTYGLRPEGLPIKSGFRYFGSLFTPNNGLAGLQEEPADADPDVDDNEMASFDMVYWDDKAPETSPPPSVEGDQETEYETTPAVGGGTIT